MMTTINDFPEVPTELIKEEVAKETANTLNLVNYQIAELLRIKEELEKRLNAVLEHGDDGSKTYVVDKFKVTVTTGYNYTLNKDEYEVVGNQLQACFNPVRTRTAYDLDKKVIKDAEKYASKEELQLLSQIISKKAKKLHVKVSPAV